MKHPYFCLLLMLGPVSTILSCLPDCRYYRYVIVTEISDSSVGQTTIVKNCTCLLTLSELIKLRSNGSSAEKCGDIDLTFQSGTHLVTNLMMPLLFQNLNNLHVRGQSNSSTIIKCWNSQPSFNFTDILSIRIQYIHIEKCRTEFGESGIHLTTKNILFTKVEISDSIFVDSGITLYSDIEYRASAMIVIEDTTIANYSWLHFNSPTFLNVDSNSLSFDLELKNLNFSYNSQSLLFLLSTTVEPFVLITGINYFIQNKFSIITLNSYGRKLCRLHFSAAEVHFIDNSNTNHDIIKSDNYSPIHVLFGSTVLFEHSIIFFNNNFGGIVAHQTKVIFSDNTSIHFNNNSGLQNGGALSLKSSSTLIFIAERLNISLNFIRNTAAQKGGAIYVEDGASVISVFNLQCDVELVQMTFSNNSALLSGNQIYGGWVDWFKNESGYFHNSFIDKILYLERRTDSDVASDLIRVCLCKNGQPECNVTNHTMHVYGDAASVEVVAVGQRYTPVAAFVKASLSSDSSKCNDEIWKYVSPRIASLPATCTRITYKFIGPKEIVLQLKSDLNNNYCVESKLAHSHDVLALSKDQILFQQLFIKVKRMRCPRTHWAFIWMDLMVLVNVINYIN